MQGRMSEPFSRPPYIAGFLTIQPLQARARSSMNRSPDTNEAEDIELDGYAGGTTGKPSVCLHSKMQQDFFGCILDEK
jgi:acyl-coenzyme A synthetase/AMP-(fatty) acid ligase